MTERIITCRYLRRDGNQCTAEAVDPEADVLLCGKHLARAYTMVRAKAGYLDRVLHGA